MKCFHATANKGLLRWTLNGALLQMDVELSTIVMRSVKALAGVK
jgi:hypothetical protein